MEAFSFDAAASVLQRLEVPLPVAEAHGLLCGLLCTRPGPAAKSRWFAELLEAAALAPETLATRTTPLHALDSWYSQCQQALNGPDLDYALCLPEDDTPLLERLAALSDFCAGFGYGIGIGLGEKGSSHLPADTRELLADFQAIEGSDTQAAAGDADAEHILVELSEYVRMGVLLILEELQPVPPAGAGVH